MARSNKRQATTTMMMSMVTVSTGSRLQYNPNPHASEIDKSWQQSRAGQRVRVTAFDEEDSYRVYVRFEKDGYETEHSHSLGSFILLKPTLTERFFAFLYSQFSPVP